MRFKKIIKYTLIKLIGEKVFRLYIYAIIVNFNRLIKYRTLKINSKINIPILRFGGNKSHTYFGYYDINPFNKNGDLLATKTSLENTTPKYDRKMRIGYYSLSDKKTFHEIGQTTTWCWQQGCRLQWYNNSDDKIIYNKMIEDNLGSVIQNIYSKEFIKTINNPIYSVANSGEWGLTLNFQRLHKYRPGYGYNNNDTKWSSLKSDNDGIWLIDLKNNNKHLLFSISEISQFYTLDTMQGANHYFNHIQINPSNDRFLFFHLWVKNDKRYSRLITSKIDGSELYPLINEGHVSHYNWISESKIIAYSTHQDTGTFYHLYEDMTGNYHPLKLDILLNDGHPTISSDGRYLLTDTYPDKFGDQKLILHDFKNKKTEILGEYFSPLKYRGEMRCDLHPRFNKNGNMICFDSALSGRRQLYVIKLS